jgi:signal transduction histidine kinase
VRLLPEIVKTTTFRWTLAIASAFAACTLLLFGFVYWQSAVYLTADVDQEIAEKARGIASMPPDEGLNAMEEWLRVDPRRVHLAGLFDPDGHIRAGNMGALPSGLEPDGTARKAHVMRVDNRGQESQTLRAVARRLPDGGVVVVGHDDYELEAVAKIVGRALVLGMVPTLCLALATGAFLSRRGERRVEEVGKRVRRIVAGDLRQRLPTRGVDDPFDKLARIVNSMLAEIEVLVHELAAAGDDIAHDLRTPLTRVRATLERGRENARTIEALQAVVDRAIAGIDQSLALVTALLRIAEIEHSRRRAGFGDVDLAGIVRDIAELYQPIADEKRILLRVSLEDAHLVRGDRDLLFEAIANLVDNALKFTPAGGRVDVAVARGRSGSVVRVSDTGPGIKEAEREAVFKRFYRSDKSRHTDGLGLGLSLVAAIAKLHGYRVAFRDSPGCVVELVCPREVTVAR